MKERLIDANELTPIPIGMGDGVWTKWVVTYRDIHDAPTIDAIPIEWIKKYAEEHCAYIHEFENMLAEWKENGTD